MTWTIQKLLNWTSDYFARKNIEPARLCAEMLLANVLKLSRIELYTNFDKLVDQGNLDKLRQLIKRAVQNEPIQYIIGKTEFYSLSLKVSQDTLIPRPETELLVERAVEFLRSRSDSQYVCDLCTGSGCIAVAIAKNFPDCTIIATDISEAALQVAADNIAAHNLTDKIKLLSGDLFEPLLEHLDKPLFDLIVSNPPYVSDAEFESLDRNVKDYEPSTALKGGKAGIDIYQKIIAGADEHLKPDAALMLEIGHSQGEDVMRMLEEANLFADIKIEKDLADNDRIAIATRK